METRLMYFLGVFRRYRLCMFDVIVYIRNNPHVDVRIRLILLVGTYVRRKCITNVHLASNNHSQRTKSIWTRPKLY